MPDSKANIFSLQGEILEIYEQKRTSTIKVICKPEWVLLNITKAKGFKLKDKIRMEGEFRVREMYKIELDKSESLK